MGPGSKGKSQGDTIRRFCLMDAAFVALEMICSLRIGKHGTKT